MEIEDEEKRLEELAKRLGISDDDVSEPSSPTINGQTHRSAPTNTLDYLDEKLLKIEETVEEPIDTSQFSYLSTEELVEILNLTIKHDETQKLITFLCMLSAYTDSSQFNVSFNSPSATGKSYIPLEVAQLFPKDDVLELAYCSPTAFFHDVGEFSRDRNEYTIDLSRKILILLDMPHTELLAKLRPLFSHDKKEILLKITDKKQRMGLKTKNVKLVGYPAVIYCSASMKIDEQEATRFLLLSPDTTKEKIIEALFEKIKRDSNGHGYHELLESNTKRALVKKRILAIRREKI